MKRIVFLMLILVYVGSLFAFRMVSHSYGFIGGNNIDGFFTAYLCSHKKTQTFGMGGTVSITQYRINQQKIREDKVTPNSVTGYFSVPRASSAAVVVVNYSFPPFGTWNIMNTKAQAGGIRMWALFDYEVHINCNSIIEHPVDLRPQL